MIPAPLRRVADERFLMHRLRSTSLAAVVGGVLLGGLAMADLIAHSTTRWDLLGVLAAMAATKVGRMVHLRMTD